MYRANQLNGKEKSLGPNSIAVFREVTTLQNFLKAYFVKKKCVMEMFYVLVI